MAVNRPVVLVVGFADSVHTARWLNMVLGHEIQFVLLSAYFDEPSREFAALRRVANIRDLALCSTHEVAVFDLTSVTAEDIADVHTRAPYEPWRPIWLDGVRMTHLAHLVAAVRRFRPILIHSMIVQFGGYLCLAGKEYLGDEFPAWLLSNWGSDIFLFRMTAAHQPKLARIASLIDAYHAECARDYAYIRQMGFRGFLFPPLPASGGTDFSRIPALDTFPRTSARRDILIKGYHGWSGRGLHILSAVHMAADALRGYTIRITVAGQHLKDSARAIASATGLNIVVESHLPLHRDAIDRLGNCRTVVGLGISDGISTTLLEAMAVGTFPIQGCGSCGNEWIHPDRTGILVNPHDVQALAGAIRRSVTDDAMVDAAAPINREIVEKGWNAKLNGEVAVHHYRALIDSVSNRSVPANSSLPALVHG
jgi:glycosyltransferase involved in cell wall biosynthesis